VSTIQTIVTAARVRLDEPVAAKFSDASQLIPYTSKAERRLAGILNRIPKGRRFRALHEEITLPANAETYDLTSLAKPFDWLIEVSVLVGTAEVLLYNFEDGDSPALKNMGLAGGSIISRIDLQDDNLVVRPKFGTARTMYVSYAWIPLAKTSASDAIETPTKYDDDLRDYVVWMASADLGLVNNTIDEQFALREAEIEDLERSRRGTSNEKVLSRGHAFSRCR
jgi:hypothetical protein